ncbi:hypothetical protein [Novispirillum itersonii]|uniref:hypothetical protein n=1 Tax=Novispirillum itersonii TaxID=189 RepID=UPI000365B38B|nr:hypothetical protein [Novispirillum itersonii]
MKRFVVLALATVITVCNPASGKTPFQVAGLSLEMSPLQVQQAVVANGWTEDDASGWTLKELAIRTETGQFWRESINRMKFGTKTPHQSQVKVDFCGRRIFRLETQYKIPEDQYEAEVKHARDELQALGTTPIREETKGLFHQIAYKEKGKFGYTSVTFTKPAPWETDYQVKRTLYSPEWC